MTLDELTSLLEAWYEVASGALGHGLEKTAPVRNPILRRFYAQLGKLTEIDEPWWRYGGQDTFLSLRDLRIEDAATVFGLENQGNFRIAAPDDGGNALVDGLNAEIVFPKLEDSGIALEECIVAFVLREVVFTGDAIRNSPAASAIATAKAGRYVQARYVDSSAQNEFWLAENIWLMNIAESHQDWIANRGAWRGALSP